MRDRADFEHYVEQRSARLLRAAYLLCRDRGTAEDLLQTALAKAWLAWRRVGDDPDPYVYRILVNTHATWWRRRWRGEVPSAVLPEAPDGDTVDAVVTREAVRQVLAGLPGRQRAVIVAGVHRRVRAIRRRRRWVAGGAVAVALNTPAGGVTDDLDVWTGVMARPSPTVPTTSQPLGGPYPGDEVASGGYRTGGTRERLRIESGSELLGVTVHCSGPLRRAIVWIGDGPPRRHLCGTGPDGYPMTIFRETPGGQAIRGGDRLAGGRFVSAVVLPGEVDRAGRTAGELVEEMDGFFEGWEEQLAEAKSFPLDWALSVREMIPSVCRDNVRQLDPRTGEMVRLTCEGGTTPPGGP